MERPDIAHTVSVYDELYTFEALQSELKKEGYYISKKPERKIKLLPCTCGSKQIHMRRDGRARYFSCGRCGLTTGEYSNQGTALDNEKAARLAWNAEIERRTEPERREETMAPAT